MLFETGGYRYAIQFVKAGKRIPGVNPEYAEKVFAYLPHDAESIRLKQKQRPDGSVEPPVVGRLVNYGLGPALSVEITWNAKTIFIGDETFEVNHEKRNEPRYSPALNRINVRNVSPGAASGVRRIPTFIEKDTERTLRRVDGSIQISYSDVFGERFIVEQEFKIFTEYHSDSPYVHVTFGDLRSPVS